MPSLKFFFRGLLGVLFIAAGLNHFWNTGFYVAMMPPYLPWHGELVYASGLVEVALGLWLLTGRRSRLAGWGVVALCVAVFPVHVHMALNPDLFSQYTPTGLWLRIPLQLLIMAWALWVTRLDAPGGVH